MVSEHRMGACGPNGTVVRCVRLIALLTVGVLVLAPSIIRAVQRLEHRPSTALKFSRASAPPPVRTHLEPPDDGVLGPVLVEQSTFVFRSMPLLDADEPTLPPAVDGDPDPPRGPPPLALL